MITHEVVWDGTDRGGRYLLITTPKVKIWPRTPVTRIVPRSPIPDPQAPTTVAIATAAPVSVEPAPAAPETVKCLRRKADADVEPLKLQVYRFLLRRDAAITDIVAHFKHSHCMSKVYSAVAALRTSGHAVVVRREVRERAKGVGPLMRDVYGPATGTGEL